MSEPSTNSVQLDALLKLFSLCDSTEAAPWLKDYLFLKYPAGPEDLANKSDEELQETINDLVNKYSTEELPVPDILFNFTGLTNTIVTSDVNGKEDISSISEIMDEAGQDVSESDKNESNDELDDNELLNKKLEVAKSFIKDLDEKIDKYESKTNELTEANTNLTSQLEEKITTLQKFESLGTPEELESLKSNYIELQEKYENASSELEKKESVEATSAQTTEEGTLKAESEKTEEDSNTMSSEDKNDLLKKYQELGTPEELAEFKKACKDKSDDQNSDDDDSSADKAKNEALEAENKRLSDLVQKYAEIGEPEEIQALVDQIYAEKMESEAERIAIQYGITTEKARDGIEKFESVTDFEDFLTDLTPKTESIDEDHSLNNEDNKDKNESASDEAIQLAEAKRIADEAEAAALKEKSESAEKVDEQHKEKFENGLDDERRSTLKNIISKL